MIIGALRQGIVSGSRSYRQKVGQAFGLHDRVSFVKVAGGGLVRLELKQ